MCGICGIFRPDRGPVETSRVRGMRDALAYRGPDASGLSHGAGYALGHRRLSIIDLSESGSQPMRNEDGTLEIVFNGEIYNFGSLRDELVAKGHTFQSRTDTEILLHGYEEWGLGSLLRTIRGMYAFAILDHKLHQLHLIRDPVGKKPLFFRFSDGELAFASSVRSLLLGLPQTPEIDVTAVDSLLTHMFIPGPKTILRGVEKVLPGHAVTIGRDGKRTDLVYWQPDFLNPDESLTDEQWLEKTEVVLENSVRRRLVADVPIGILLSGGIDSSLVTAMAARLTAEVRTFSVASHPPAVDESGFAKAVAERHGTVHEVLKVDHDTRVKLPKLVAAMGEPLADASAINTFAIAEKAREFVTVILTGDGGDEAFGGYSQFLAYYYAGRISGAVRPFESIIRPLSLSLLKTTGTFHRVGTLLRLASSPVEDTLFSEGELGVKEKRDLYTEELQHELGNNNTRLAYLRALPGDATAPAVHRVMQARMMTLMPDDYLTKVDNGTMAVSLEARSPFLDVDVLDLAMRIPVSTRFRGGKSKSLLRRLALKLVPKHCVNRRKQGFVAPIGMWLRQWSDLVDDLILGPHVERRGWFKRSALQRTVHEHMHGIDHAYLLWSLLVLELWLRLSVDGTVNANDRL